MSAILIGNKISISDLQKAREDYGDYVKVTVDIVSGAVAIIAKRY